MSVDTLRETFHINRITPDKIQDFLTAQTYRPEITKAKEDIKALPWVFLQHVCKRPIRQGKSPSYADDTGLLCIKPKNTNGMIVSLEELSYIQPVTKDEVAGQRLQRGDIVITRSGSGTIGRASIFLSDEEVYTNDHLFIVRTDSADSHYTCAFLNTYWGHRLLEAGISGSTGQLNLSNEHIKGITLYTPAELAQKYIGDKVRQAERLRAWAKLAETHVNQYHQKLVPQQTGLDFAKRVRVVSSARMSERLDAHFYPGVVDEYLRLHKGKFKQLGKLCATIYNGQTQPEMAEPASCKQITVTNLSSSFLGGTPRDVEAPVKKEKFLKAYDILMCNAAHNKSYIGKDLTFVHSEAAILPSTEVMTIRVDRNQVPSSYVRAYLLTKLGYVQIQSTIRGITAHSYPDDMALLDIYVPDVADKDKEEWFACDEKLALAGKACEVATQLTNATKLLVEALIEGKLTEAELLTAEKALQASNDRLDRLILSRLNTDGIDGQGPALFGDLDELYHLLTQAEGD
jgi:type I restriction enzyme S subunit